MAKYISGGFKRRSNAVFILYRGIWSMLNGEMNWFTMQMIWFRQECTERHAKLFPSNRNPNEMYKRRRRARGLTASRLRPLIAPRWHGSSSTISTSIHCWARVCAGWNLADPSQEEEEYESPKTMSLYAWNKQPADRGYFRRSGESVWYCRRKSA